MPSSQRALVVKAIGQPLVLVNDWPVPQPGPGQVQLRVSVAGLNGHDQKSRDLGIFIREHLPAVLANDVVGRVTALGPGVDKYALGDRVVLQAAFAPGSLQNGLQEYAVADADFSAAVPDSMTDDEAATLPTNIVAPLVALFETLRIPAPWTPEAASFGYADTTLLIVGGGSNCGRFGVQLAKLAGIGKIIVVGGDRAELKSYGATHVLDRHGGHDAVLGRIKEVVGDDLLYAFDTVNFPDGQILAVNALSSHKRGAMARLLPVGPVDDQKIVGKNAGYEVLNVFGSSQARPGVATPFWKLLPTYLQQGKIKPLAFVVKDGLDADAVNATLDAYASGQSVTKTHIHV